MTDMNQNDELLLDETLDDLADAPSQELWPAGAYAATMKVKRNDKKPGSYIVNFTCQEAIELTDPNAEAPKEGDQTAVFIHTLKKDGSKNEYGQGDLKKILKPVAAAINSNAISEILDVLKDGVDVIVVLKVRKSKDANYDDSQVVVKLELPAA